MTKEKIQQKISQLEDSLAKEMERQREVLRRQGWGYGMRHVKIGVSTTKSDRLKARIATLKEQLKAQELCQN